MATIVTTTERPSFSAIRFGDRGGRVLTFIRHPDGQVVAYRHGEPGQCEPDELVAWLTVEQAHALAAHIGPQGAARLHVEDDDEDDDFDQYDFDVSQGLAYEG